MKFGAIQSPADPRDYIYAKMIRAAVMPPAFAHDRLPVRDQGKYGTCVGQAAAGIKDRQERINYPGRGYRMSPLFIYGECKRRDGIPDIEGTYPRVAMGVLKDLGACRESTLPYTMMGDPLPTPPAAACEEAKQFTIGAYARIQSLSEIKTAIMRDGPVMGAVQVTDSFIESEAGFVNLPAGSILGGHGILFDGWDDNMSHRFKDGRTLTGFLRFPNSWSDSWGDDGYGYLPYAFLDWRGDLGQAFFMEAWSSVDVILPPKAASEVVLWVGHTRALVDGQEITLDQAPVIDPTSKRTLVPLRFIGEEFGYEVEWDGLRQQITLRK